MHRARGTGSRARAEAAGPAAARARSVQRRATSPARPWHPAAPHAAAARARQHRRRRVRIHPGRRECLPERLGRSCLAVAGEGEAVLGTTGVDHLARDHLEVALRPVPAAHVAAIKPDHDRAGWLRCGELRIRGGALRNDVLAHAQRPVLDRASVLRPTDRQQLGQEGRDLAERRQCRKRGGHGGQFRGRTRAEIEGCEALRLARTAAGADEQPSDPDRHVGRTGSGTSRGRGPCCPVDVHRRRTGDAVRPPRPPALRPSRPGAPL